MFLNALMLAGIAGAAVPLVLHLLARARYRTVDWGAMMFLVDVNARQQQSARLKQIVLLLLRMAIVATLAVALARPVVSSTWGAIGDEGRTTAAIILDRSGSMAFDEGGGRTRLDLAKEAVLQVLSSLDKGDRVVLIPVGDGRRGVDPRPESDLQALAGRVADLKVVAGATDLAEALTTAADALDRHERLSRQIFVVTDRQAANWRNVDATFAAALRRRLDQATGGSPAPAPTRIHVIPVGGDAVDNVTVESVALTDAPAIKDSAGEVEVTVRNYGATPRTGLPLTVRARQRELLATTVNLAPNSAATVRFQATFPVAGDQTLTAEVKSSGLTADDALNCVVEVIDPVRVLIVSGDERPPEAGAFRGESDFLRLAMAPFGVLGRTGTDPAVVDVKPADQWADPDLSGYRVLVLANVPEFTPQQVRAIEQFVYGGGGLLVAPGNLARADGYNRTLHRDGAGVLPAVLYSPTPADGSQSTSLLGIEMSHPVFGFLRGRPDPIPSATVGRYFPAWSRDGGGGRVLASYASGFPFLVEATYGRGRVLQMTTAADADWNTLPLTSFYLPFVRSAVRYVAAASLAERNLAAGQELRASFAAAVDRNRVTVYTPVGPNPTVELTDIDGRAELRYADTHSPGTYQVRARVGGEDRWLPYVVRPPKEEADPTPLSAERWAELESQLDLHRIDPRRESVAAVLKAERSGRELWFALLLAVVALSMVELALARWWTSDAR
jgi:hypothetical protein